MRVPKFSDIQKTLSRVFFKRDCIIHIFTEDKEDDQLFYELLLRRFETDSLKIGLVQPIGSRANVMKRSLQDKTPTVPTLYLIDGDIDIMKTDPIESENLIGLDRYCIENYLCCEVGLASLLNINFGNTLAHYQSKLEFRPTLNKFGSEFLKIAIRYNIAQELGCSTGFKKATDFFYIRSGGVFKIDKQKIKAEVLRVETLIKDKLRGNNVRAYNRELLRRINELESKNSFSVENYLKVLSGKDFIFPVLEKKIKLIESKLTPWSADQLKRNLAERIDIQSLDRLKLKMESMV